MRKLYKCNRCGAPALLDFEGQCTGFIEAITMCANRHCCGVLVPAERVPSRGMELVT
jgi:hypothetical protein